MWYLGQSLVWSVVHRSVHYLQCSWNEQQGNLDFVVCYHYFLETEDIHITMLIGLFLIWVYCFKPCTAWWEWFRVDVSRQYVQKYIKCLRVRFFQRPLAFFVLSWTFYPQFSFGSELTPLHWGKVQELRHPCLEE